jgi:acetoin utilization deacetylase AcuC-like enzyme
MEVEDKEGGAEKEEQHAEHDCVAKDESESGKPQVLNIGLPWKPAAAARRQWRDAYRDHVFPRLMEFKPDMLFISAGFDAHAKDELNLGYLAVIETDFEWITDELVKIANSCCDGRVVSVLEGGYKIQGGVSSAFAQSVASHVRALHKNSKEPWDPADNQWQKDFERKMEVRLLCKPFMSVAQY